ncbi:XdhC family protein [Streptomyces sp. NBC_00878]|uniref:XdhC family protein n=1 Tax=Streptomyces sp. NBC_00878 TaxID=2975854 RepID=UPI0022570E13|nr:XdhC family protein [Streptomyces sp. NBC_00878]MCX4911419.1 XdhC family protein [Streptomyces sp. NBC_00878]
MSPAAPPLEARMAELTGRHEPFVKATVVRARRPASARPGDTALVLADGRIEGFVGGVCAEATVRAQALRTLRSGESLLLRISPEETAAGVREEGMVSVANPCLSGGELEIFLEPLRPVPRVTVVGDSPIARALTAFGPTLGYEITPTGGITADDLSGTLAVVIASHGRDEEPVLVAAVRAGVPYIGLVASPRRGAAVLAGLDLDDEQRARVRTPAGLWIGARTPGEIAVSILAEVIQVAGSRSAEAEAKAGVKAEAEEAVRTATDPVCGMTVAVADGTPYSDAGGGDRRWFCCAGCRTAYEQDPAPYAEAAAS